MCTDIKVGDLLECVATSSSEFDFGDIVPVIKKISEITFLAKKEDTREVFKLCRNTGGTWTYSTWDNCFEFKKVEKMEKFKAGDLVFEVVPNRKIKLVRLTSNNEKLYPVRSYEDSYTHEGYIFVDEDGTPSLFHATPENRQALVTLYGEDAVPELPLRGSELTKKLTENQRYVLALVSCESDDEAREDCIVEIIIDYEDGCFVTNNDEIYDHAVAVDNNGKEITELGGDDE